MSYFRQDDCVRRVIEDKMIFVSNSYEYSFTEIYSNLSYFAPCDNLLKSIVQKDLIKGAAYVCLNCTVICKKFHLHRNIVNYIIIIQQKVDWTQHRATGNARVDR